MAKWVKTEFGDYVNLDKAESITYVFNHDYENLQVQVKMNKKKYNLFGFDLPDEAQKYIDDLMKELYG